MIRHLRPARPLERRELVVIGLFSIVALTQGWTGAVITHALPFIQTDLDLSDSQVFDMMTLIRAVSLVAIGFSWWGDHRGRRLPLLAAFAVLPVSNLATVFVDGPLAIALAQSTARVGTIAIGALALVVLAEEVGPDVRGWTIGVYAMVGAMGTGLGLLLRPLGAEPADGWRILFAISALPLIALPFLIRRLAESRAYRRPTTRPPLAAVLRTHAARFWPLAGLAFAVSAFTAPAANLALIRMEVDLGWSPGSASLLLAVASGPGVFLGVLLGGRLADLLGRRPTEVISALLGVGGGVAFYLIDAGPILAIGIFFSNLGAFAFGPAFGSHRAELFPTEVRATAGAWTVNAAILGGLAGFAAGRFVVDAWGIPSTITALGGFVVVSLFLVALLPETKGTILTQDEADPGHSPGAIPV